MPEYSKPILIAAMGNSREIGQNGNLPWYIPEDLQFFKTATAGSSIVVGRKTWDDMKSSLPGRAVFTVSKDGRHKRHSSNCVGVGGDQAIEYAIELSSCRSVSFIIGGAQIYDYVLKNKLVDKMYITHVRGDFPDADAFFPEVAWNEWDGTVLMLGSKTEKSPAYEIIEYTRR